MHHAEQPVGLFSLDGHPHLKAVAIDPPDLTAYRALTGRGMSVSPGHIPAPGVQPFWAQLRRQPARTKGATP
jgi:hypothetical protein